MDDVVAMLLEEGVLDQAGAEKLRASGAADLAGDEKALKVLARLYDVPFVDLADVKVPREVLSKFPAKLLLARKVLPLSMEGDSVLVATSDLFDPSALEELRVATGFEMRPALAPVNEIERAIKRLLGVGADTLQSMSADGGVKIIEEEEDGVDLSAGAEDASIIKFVNQILAEALDLRATDVHVEPFENQLRVRYRIDGELTEANIPGEIKKYQPAIVSRIKILSHLDIAEKRIPQDGRIRLKVSGREIDLRVSVIPMIHGEAVVMRILDRGDAAFGLEHLGMSSRDRKVFDEVLELPHGIVLVTGPTGSGKTTTLYAALATINSIDRKIITIEDPVEYQLRGINQIPVNTKTGMTFASGLRAILRHDPDVVLIGEIRDRETAEIAVQASLTGHLVFSTLHTNDAPSAATRLIDMGIEPYLVASSVEMVLAQRLVRLICKNCKEVLPREDYEKLKAEFGAEVPEVMYRGAGCRTCMGTGFKGRQGVFEMMPMSDEIRELILERSSSPAIRKVAVAQGMTSLREDAWRLVREGRTTIQEVMRNTKDEDAVIGRKKN